MNPLGDAPLFLAMTAGYDEAVRAIRARRIAVYSFALLLDSMLIGGFVLGQMIADAPRPAAVTVDPARVQSRIQEHWKSGRERRKKRRPSVETNTGRARR